MKVAILTMFGGLSTTYSLVNVVADHISMLLAANISVKILVSEDCPDTERYGVYADERLEWVKITNRLNGKQIHWHDYSSPNGEVHPSFFQEAEIIAEDFADKLMDVDVCMMHDILYQGWHLVHNIAIRKAQQKLAHVKFIAFTHSLPVNPPPQSIYPFSARFEPMPNTLFAYPTLSGIPALAKQYHIPEGKCRAVYNTLPLLESACETVRQIHGKMSLLSPDILIVFPGRLTTGKRFEKVAALAGAIQSITEQRTSVVFCDFPSMDTPRDLYKARIKAEGKMHGVLDGHILFTSDVGYPNGISREAVLQLFGLSNLFICPSFSESFGLTVLEAASRGNFLVLNEAVPALEELGKRLHAYFMRWDARNFGFDSHENYSPSEKVYYEEHARKIVDLMREDRVVYAKTKTRQDYSPDWIWENQLAPLLE
ncbi:MAG: glycosyltransferase [Angelakisella sp.]